MKRIIFHFLVLFLIWGAENVFAAKLDIEGRDLSGQDIKEYGGLTRSGVLVTKSTGNALAAGIMKGDVIIAIDEEEVSGVFEMEESLRAIRGKKFKVKVHRVQRRGLLKLQTLTYDIESPIDLQYRKAYTLNLGDENLLTVGKYRGQTLLLWHANRVWIYDKQLQKESFVSLLKVYSIAEHKTYRYKVLPTVVMTRFLTDDGLLMYISSGKSGARIGVMDIESGERNIRWTYEIEKIKKKSYDVKFGDVNGDRIPEIYYSFDARVTCLDGATGNVIWTRNDLTTYFNQERSYGDDSDYSKIFVDDFTRDGSLEVSVGPLLLNGATGAKKMIISFDPVKYQGGILECRQLLGDPIPDIISGTGLYDGNSSEKVWEPLRSQQYFLADLTGDGVYEIIYLLRDQKLHVHDLESHRELYSINVEGGKNLALNDFNNDSYADFLVRKGKTAYLYQTNIPMSNIAGQDQRGVGYATSLLDFGLKKDKFYVFGREMFDKGEYAESIPLFMRAMAENPEREDTIRYLALAFIKTKNFEGALSLLRQKENTYAREVLHQFSSEVVSYLLDRNETWQAINFLEMKKDSDPLLLARCYLAIGKPEVAVKLILDIKEKPVEAQLLLGRAYVLMNKMISARIAFKNYLKYYPTSSEGWHELGQLETHEENWDEAEEAFKICYDLDEILGAISLSSFYLKPSRKKNLDYALKLARRAHRLEPSSRTKIQLANVLVEYNNYDEAGIILSQIEDPGPEFNRFEKLMQRAEYQVQATQKYQEAEKLLLSPVFKKRNFLTATQMLEDLIAKYPKSTTVPLAHYRLGEIFLDPDHRDENKALFHFKEIIKTGHELSPKARRQIRIIRGVDESVKLPPNRKINVRTIPTNNASKPLELDPPTIDLEEPGEEKAIPDQAKTPVKKSVVPAELDILPEKIKGRRTQAKADRKKMKEAPLEILILDSGPDRGATLEEKLSPLQTNSKAEKSTSGLNAEKGSSGR